MEEWDFEDLTEEEKRQLERFCSDFVRQIRANQGYSLHDDEKRLEGFGFVNTYPFHRQTHLLTEEGARFVFKHFCKSDNTKSFAGRFKEVFGESIYADEWDF